MGLVNFTKNTAALDTLYRIPNGIVSEPPALGTHSIQLHDTDNAVLAKYPFTPGKDSEAQPGEDLLGVISEVVPWVSGTQRVAVYTGTLELDSRIVSAHTPTVNVISPNGGEILTDTVVVSWSASDADLDLLTYALQYSTDNGESWQAVSVGIDNTTVYTLDLTMLPGSDQARVQIIASDGVNTDIDASDGSFYVTRKPPQARIISPLPDSSFTHGQTIMLVGKGYDLEDGTLADSALTWQSNRSGMLGAGRMLAVTNLAIGRHVISLTATDSEGYTDTASVIVVVLGNGSHNIFLPLVSSSQ
jgi:hypothetical protein